MEEMLADPAAHPWVRVSHADIGEPGCRDWHVRPRFGLLGMLAGWWRVVVSSGCPLQPEGCFATRLTLLAVVAALAVTGCGGDDDEDTAADADGARTAHGAHDLGAGRHRRRSTEPAPEAETRRTEDGGAAPDDRRAPACRRDRPGAAASGGPT